MLTNTAGWPQCLDAMEKMAVARAQVESNCVHFVVVFYCVYVYLYLFLYSHRALLLCSFVCVAARCARPVRARFHKYGCYGGAQDRAEPSEHGQPLVRLLFMVPLGVMNSLSKFQVTPGVPLDVGRERCCQSLARHDAFDGDLGPCGAGLGV